MPQVPEGTPEVPEETGPIAPAWAISDQPEDEAPAGPHGAVAPTIANQPQSADLPDVGPSASPFPSVEDDSRVARAASNRVVGNFKMGKKPQHALAVAIAAVAAIGTVVGGAALGSLLPPPGETLAYSGENTPDGGGLAVDPEAIARWDEANGDAFVEVQLNGCLPQTSAIAGVALDPRIVIVPTAQVESDETPSIVQRDGTRQEGRTVGALPGSGFSVVRLTTPLPTSLSWGPMINVSEGMDVRVASITNGSVTLQANTIEQLRRTSTGVLGMDLATQAPQGSVVLDSNNLVIGIVTRAGTFAADSSELSPKVSDAVLNQEQIAPVCPAPDPNPEDPDADGADTGEGADG